MAALRETEGHTWSLPSQYAALTRTRLLLSASVHSGNASIEYTCMASTVTSGGTVREEASPMASRSTRSAVVLVVGASAAPSSSGDCMKAKAVVPSGDTTTVSRPLKPLTRAH